MSYIIVQYQNPTQLNNLLATESDLIKITSELFGKNPEEVVVDYQKFGTYRGERKILIRAETSVKNVDLLMEWSEKIKIIFENKKIDNFGIKTYVVESCWQEENK